MVLENFLHETRQMKILHLFFDAKHLDIFKPLQYQHPHFHIHDLAKDAHTIPPFDILFIELGENTKDKLKMLLGIFSKHKPLASYLFAEDVEDKLLLKFALHFGITDVLPLRNNETLLNSIFTKNSTKLDERLQHFQKLDIAQKLERSFAFFVFQEDKLTYANTKAKAFLGQTHLDEMQRQLYDDDELYTLLHAPSNTQKVIVVENEENEKELYLGLVNVLPYKQEKVLSILPYEVKESQNNGASILNRFDFIDQLKDKLVQQSVTQTPISLLCIRISNLEKLNQSFSNIALHEALKHFLSKIFQLKSPMQVVAQWSPNLYILLCEQCTFEEACEQTRYLQQELINATQEEKITPVLISSTLHIQNHSLNDLLHYIEKINTHTLLPQDIEKLNYYEIGYLENIVESQDQISYLMRNCINNKIPIKLLNIYKGLCINTHSNVIKYNDDAYYLSCENLQGYAMQLEGETVLQASNFPKDIKAEVSLVDIKKGFVVITNLHFLPNSANNRQHTRVQTNIRTPVLIKYAQKSSVQGEVVDISINSIAMRCNRLVKDQLLNQPVRLNFSLPSQEGENGYVIMDIEAKVTFVAEKDDYSKIVVMVGKLKKPYDDYLLNYMYNRQKELILEIKRATKVYN